MKWARHPRTKFLFAFFGILAIVVSLVVRLSRVSKNKAPNTASVVIALTEKMQVRKFDETSPRNKVLREIIVTEEDYIDALDVLVNVCGFCQQL